MYVQYMCIYKQLIVFIINTERNYKRHCNIEYSSVLFMCILMCLFYYNIDSSKKLHFTFIQMEKYTAITANLKGITVRNLLM